MYTRHLGVSVKGNAVPYPPTNRHLFNAFSPDSSDSIKHFSKAPTTHPHTRHRRLPIAQSMTWDTQSQILVGALIVDLAINVGGWLVATLLQSEYFYDLLGSISYLSLAIGSLAYGGTYFSRQIVMTTLVSVWCCRLGSFLFFRVIKTGGDSRFHEIKSNPLRFLVAWLIQSVWVWVCSLPLLLLNSDNNNPDWFGWSDGLGIALWLIGFLVESIADFQKFDFKMNPANRGKFVNVGLWKYAR